MTSERKASDLPSSSSTSQPTNSFHPTFRHATPHIPLGSALHTEREQQRVGLSGRVKSDRGTSVFVASSRSVACRYATNLSHCRGNRSGRVTSRHFIWLRKTRRALEPPERLPARLLHCRMRPVSRTYEVVHLMGEHVLLKELVVPVPPPLPPCTPLHL